MRGLAGSVGAALLLSGCAMVRTPYVVAVEHELGPADQTRPVEQQLEPEFAVVGEDGTVQAAGSAARKADAGASWDQWPEPVWQWPLEHLKAGGRFPDPFLGPEIYPEVSVGSKTVAANVVRSKRFEFFSALDLSFYWLSLEVPVVDTLNGSRPQPRLGLDFKVPFALPGAPSNWVALFYGASISEDVPVLADSSRMQAMWGYGGRLLATQLRVGYGYAQTFASSELRQGLLYGAQLGLNLGKVQPLVEVDGVSFNGHGDQVTILPGLQFLPAALPTMQLGVSGLIGLTFDDSTLSNRYGAVVEASYNFL